jgi:membrane protein
MIKFFRQLVHGLMNDDITSVGAMMAYYAVLALFPMMVFVGSLALLVLPEHTIREGVAMASTTLPGGVRDEIDARIDALLATANAKLAIGAVVLALWGASRGAVSLGNVLNRMFNKKDTRPWWKRQVIAIAVTLGVAVLMVAALGVLVVGRRYSADHFGLVAVFDIAWNAGRWIGAGLLVMVVWALCYKFLPDTDAPFRVLTLGAFVGVLLWLAISALFGVYLRHFNSYETTYGTLGTVIIFLTWLWMSNVALLFGAEVNNALPKHRATT